VSGYSVVTADQPQLKRLDELATSIQYGYTAKAKRGAGGPRYLRITDIQDEQVDWAQVPSCDIDDKDLSKYLLIAGDLVFARTGATVGKSFLIRGAIPKAIFASYLIRVRLNDSVDPKYVANFFRSPSYWRQISEQQAGIGQPNVNGTKLAQLSVPFVPISKQREIVAELEKQFSRLDEAVANLKRVKANLKRYKAAVLKAAVEGRLVPTEAELARKEDRTYETGSELLKRILAMRRKQWNGRSKYVEPSDPNAEFIPDLPKGWALARLDAIAALKGGITVDKGRKNSTARFVPYLRVANVQRGYLDLSEVKQIDAPAADVEQLRLLRGDILFNEGGDRDKLGRGWIWEDQLVDCIHQNHVFRARLFSSDIEPKLVSWWGNSFGKEYFSREGKQTTNLASINITKLSAFPIPIPPAAEQARIVAEVERHFSLIHGVELQTKANLARADVLRQSVLSKSFSEP